MKKAVIIAGYGSLPLIGAKELKKSSYDVLTVAIAESCSRADDLRDISDSFYIISAGQAGKILKVLKKHKPQYALLSGKVEINLLHRRVRLDLKAICLLAKIAFRSTDSINLAVIKEFEKLDISIISQKEAYGRLIYNSGIFACGDCINPDILSDIAFGFHAAKAIGRIDIGQSVAVKNGKILALESAEGTDKTFARGCVLGNGGAVCVKTGKPMQDERFDLPVVGTDTVKSIADNGGKALVIEAGETIVIDMDECVKLAKDRGIIFAAISESDAGGILTGAIPLSWRKDKLNG
ncbi:MAG: UDP-2,3-diacylglucosamine diphosphatase LpxI [Mucispirillum sp.]|nr:UDP-2,3-diacylglucosamine diphosphatase LpxI [Mucispirillum sp.]